MESLLNRIYYNPETGFGSADGLYREAKQKNNSITRKFVKEWLAKQTTDQLNKQVRRKKKTKQQPILGAIGQWNIDLIFYPRYKRQNSGYGVILTAIEVNSKYAMAYPLKNKSEKTVSVAIEQMIKDIRDSGRKIVILHSDNGSEFKNKTVQKINEKNGLEAQYCREGDHSCNGVVERFNRTIKSLINKYFTFKNTVRWVDVLPQLIKNYNSRYHRSIGKAPKDVSEEEELEIFFDKIKQTFAEDTTPKGTTAWSIGDLVRIPIKKKQFAKEGANWSSEIYTVVKVNPKSIRVEYNGAQQLIQKTKVLRIPKDTVQPKNTRSRGVNQRANADREARAERLLRAERL